MGRHDQRSIPTGTVCIHCQNNLCNECVDVIRIALGLTEPLCQCRRKKHTVEPASQQILDPETNTVHAPGLTVSEDGDVTYKI